MKIKYDVYEIQSTANSDHVRMHASIINKGKVTTEKLAQEIEYITYLNDGDVTTFISFFSHIM